MTFMCFKCGKEFSEIKFVVSHLKLNHFIKNNTVPMKCLVTGNICTQEFFCFDKLKAHVKKCKRNSSSINEPKPEFRPTKLVDALEGLNISDCVCK